MTPWPHGCASAVGKNDMTFRVSIDGIVQGVGMRPFLARLAARFSLCGVVRNVGSNVELLLNTDQPALDAFLAAVQGEAPEQARITSLAVHAVPKQTFSGFAIESSAAGAVELLSADLPLCPDCERELFDPSNRRCRHPFISCAVCGPRYSILTGAPYDRHATSMHRFALCPHCAAEYADVTDRRFHAQTIACPDCGPVLRWRSADGTEALGEAALQAAIAVLRGGGIAAVKGIGGYHLACSPYDAQAIRNLRDLKHREQKPFAVMFRDMDTLRLHCVASAEEEALLRSPARPIVLLDTVGTPFANGVSDTPVTGTFLPYAPVQALLLEALEALVMTSANRSGQPEIHLDEEMLAWLTHSGQLSGVLYHDRPIVTRQDDSVARVTALGVQLSRRSRGYAPLPVPIQVPAPRPIVGFGSDLKSAFCLLRDRSAYLSAYFGDFEVQAVASAFAANYEHMQRLFDIHPAVGACDLHPGYLSAAFARQSGLPLIGVQHHHAHVASVMAEHGLQGPVLGLAFDGTGYGDDGAVWGGEFLLCEDADYRRVGSMLPVRLAGGDSAAVDARKAALAYLMSADLGDHLDFDGAALLRGAIAHGVGTVVYSGLGRLFDAASYFLGLGQTNRYEGQCAIALETAAREAMLQGLPASPMEFGILEQDGLLLLDHRPVIEALLTPKEQQEGAKPPKASALGFHRALAQGAAEVCRRVRAAAGVSQVALSGGVFQNTLLLEELTRLLREAGFAVYTNNAVPCNDGGLALGQAYVAALRLHESNG